jgi:hypothetical protein
MSDPYNEGPEAKAARGRRNLMLAGALIAFVVIVFIVTIVRLGAHALG